MAGTIVTIDVARMRLDRAVSTTRDLLDHSPPDTSSGIEGAVTRIVIALNSLAHVLQSDGAATMSGPQVADILWSFGEDLGIRTDGARD